MNTETGGGSHFNALNYIRFLSQAGYGVVLHTLRTGVNRIPEGVVYIEHNIGTNNFKNTNEGIQKLLTTYEKEADLFFMYGVDMTWASGAYRKNGGVVPVLVYLDNYLSSMKLAQWMGYSYFIKRYLWDKFIGLRFTQYVDVFAAVSPFLRDKYVEFGFPEKACTVLPNFFSDTVSRVKSNKEGEFLQILYTGRLIRDKGVDLLLEVMADMPMHLNWQLKIVGSGPLEMYCRDFVIERGLSEHVTFIPWLSQGALGEVYETADVFVHPARWPEPFGRTIIEALEHNLPVVVPRDGGSAWIAGDAGISFVNGDKKSLYEALLAVISDATMRDRMVRNAPSRVALFSEEKIGPQFISVVKMLLHT